MPLIDSITDYQYEEYVLGFKKPHPSATFTQFGENNYGHSPSWPDPTIFDHAHGCPHQWRAQDYTPLYTKTQLPEGYRNEWTPECLDERTFNHAGYCPFTFNNMLAITYTGYLDEQGTPAIYLYDHTRFDGVVEKVYGCPHCGKHQLSLGHCEHAKVVKDALLATYESPGPASACRIDPDTEKSHWGCSWGYRHVCRLIGPKWRMDTYTGCVLGEYERNGYDDSDFIAVVWDESKQAVHHVEYGSTRYAGSGGCIVDATPEVIEKALDWHRTAMTTLYMEQSANQARTVAPGKTVRVIKAITRAKAEHNRVPAGFEGVVVSLNEGQYGVRAILVCEDNIDRSIPVDKLEVVDPWNWVATPEQAKTAADNDVYRIRTSQNYRMIGYIGVPGVLNML